MTNAPTLTPIQALTMLREKDNQTIDGIHYYLDGPMGSPIECLYPIAYVAGHGEDGAWYPTDGAETDITEATRWEYIDG